MSSSWIAQLLYRHFDRQTNPLVAEVIADHKELFAGWTEAGLRRTPQSRGRRRALTVEGAVAAAGEMNRKRQLHEKLDLVLESSHANVAAGVLKVLYEKVVVSGEESGTI